MRVWGHVRSPPTSGSASLNSMTSVISSAKTARAASLAISLYRTPVCALTFPMIVCEKPLKLSFPKKGICEVEVGFV